MTQNTDLSNLAPPPGATRNRKRVGRGQGSTLGKTSGKGQKGQNSRAGGGVPIGFEGGQMPLHRRLPKFGFNSPNRREFAIVNLHDLEERFEEGDEITIDTLKAVGLVRSNARAVKVLARGELTKKLTIKVAKISSSAKKKIEDVGGTVEVL